MPYYSFNPGGRHRPPSPPLNWWYRVLIFIAGYEPQLLLEQGSKYDLGIALAIGWLAIASMILNAGIFAITGHLIFGDGGFNLGIAFAGIAFATTVGALESFAGRASHIGRGIKAHLGAGLRIPDPQAFAGSMKHFAVYRIAISLTTAFVASTFVCLAIYKPDIAAQAQKNFQAANPAIFAQVKGAYDAEDRRLASAIAQQALQVSADERLVNTLNQADVRKTTSSNRRAVASIPPVDGRQVESLETKLNDEKAKLANLRAEAAAQNGRRNAESRKAVETSPTATPLQEGLIAQLTILNSLIVENPRVLIMVLALEFLFAGLDCAGFIARLGAPSSTYDKLLAKEHLLETVALAKDCADGLAKYDVEDGANAETPPEVGDGTTTASEEAQAPSPANDNVPHANDNGGTPADQTSLNTPKRKRGRPSNEEKAERARLNGQADPKDVA
jgi:hypothetical protein